MSKDQWEPPLVSRVLPALADELRELLLSEGEGDLAQQVLSLRIVDRCRCGDDFCAMFYVLPRPNGAYGLNHRNVSLDPEKGMLILDVVDEKIASVEVLYRDEIGAVLNELMP